jgi:hypothetical protein
MLEQVLTPGTSVPEWLELLDTLVFLWPTVKRVRTLLVKPAYAHRDHDVLLVSDDAFAGRVCDGVPLVVSCVEVTVTFHPAPSPLESVTSSGSE